MSIILGILTFGFCALFIMGTHVNQIKNLFILALFERQLVFLMRNAKAYDK